MEPKNNPIQPTNRNHRILVLILVILLTAGVIGGGTYYVLGQQNKAQEKLIDQLQKEEGEKTELELKYSDLKNSYSLKYDKYADAVASFQAAGGKEISPGRIDFYVPGKIPREDGDPYFIGGGTLDKDKNECIKGYMNLVTGEAKTWKDVCVIYN